MPEKAVRQRLCRVNGIKFEKGLQKFLQFGDKYSGVLTYFPQVAGFFL